MWKLGEKKERRASGRMAMVGLIVGAGCGIEPIESTGEPIAEVELANGGMVAFYETSPGAILIAEDTLAGADPAVRSARSPVDLYASLAPDAPVPPALIEAQARQDAARVDRPAPRPTDASLGPTAQLVCSGSGWNVIFCKLNWQANVSSGTTSVDEADWTTCAEIGNVTMRILIDGDPIIVSSVVEGQCRYVHWMSGLFDQPAGGEVVHVLTGIDRFDHVARYRF